MAIDPVSLAILGGLQVAAGAGRGIASYMAADVMSDTEKEQLKKLEREQELGMLGFSPGELQDVRQAVINPMAAMEKQQQDQLKATMSAQQAGAGDAFRMALAQQEGQRRVRAAAEDKVQQQNLIEKQREEQQLLQLAAKDAAVEAAKKAAIVEAVTGGIVAGGSFAVKAADLASSTAPAEGSGTESTAANQAADQIDSARSDGYFGETIQQYSGTGAGQSLSGIPSGPNQNMTPAQMSVPQGPFGSQGAIFGAGGQPFLTAGTPYPAFTRADGAVFDQYGNPYVDPLQSIFGAQ